MEQARYRETNTAFSHLSVESKTVKLIEAKSRTMVNRGCEEMKRGELQGIKSQGGRRKKVVLFVYLFIEIYYTGGGEYS